MSRMPASIMDQSATPRVILPPELWNHVIGFVPHIILTKVALTCLMFHAIANPRMYAAVVYSQDMSYNQLPHNEVLLDYTKIQRIIRFLHTMKQAPHLRDLVKKASIALRGPTIVGYDDLEAMCHPGLRTFHLSPWGWPLLEGVSARVTSLSITRYKGENRRNWRLEPNTELLCAMVMLPCLQSVSFRKVRHWPIVQMPNDQQLCQITKISLTDCNFRPSGFFALLRYLKSLRHLEFVRCTLHSDTPSLVEAMEGQKSTLCTLIFDESTCVEGSHTDLVTFVALEFLVAPFEWFSSPSDPEEEAEELVLFPQRLPPSLLKLVLWDDNYPNSHEDSSSSGDGYSDEDSDESPSDIIGWPENLWLQMAEACPQLYPNLKEVQLCLPSFSQGQILLERRTPRYQRLLEAFSQVGVEFSVV